MAVRKAGKTVLDYDPLSWLKGEEGEEQSSPEVSEESSASEQQAQLVSEKAGDPEETASANQSAAEESTEKPDEPAETQPVGAEEKVVAAEEISSPSTDSEPEDKVMTETAEEYFTLDSELTMKNVAEVKDQLDQLMQQDTPIAIDADALRKIDTAGLQLLYSMQKSLAKNGASISWKQESEVIKTAADIIAMDFDAVPSQKDIAEIEAEQGFGFF